MSCYVIMSGLRNVLAWLGLYTLYHSALMPCLTQTDQAYLIPLFSICAPRVRGVKTLLCHTTGILPWSARGSTTVNTRLPQTELPAEYTHKIRGKNRMKHANKKRLYMCQLHNAVKVYITKYTVKPLKLTPIAT